MVNSGLKRFLVLLAGLALVLSACLPMAYALKQGKDYDWADTDFAAKELNTLKILRMQTEYPAYKAGVSTINLEIRNFTIRRIMTGSAFILEKKTNEGWKRFAKLPDNFKRESLYPFRGDGRFIQPSSFGSFVADVKGMSAALTPGDYRIVLYVAYVDASGDMFPLSAEFKIEENGYSEEKFANYKGITTLAKDYTKDMAVKDGVYFRDKNGVTYNGEYMLGFLRKVTEGIKTKIRILKYNNDDTVTITDVTYQPDLLNFKVEEDLSRVNGGGIDTRYYSYLTYKSTSPGKIILTNSLILTYYMDKDMVLSEDVRAINAVKVNELSKKFYTGSGYFKLFGPNGKDYIMYSPVTNGEGASVIWKTQKYGGGSLPLRALGVINSLYHMEWLNERQVNIYYLSKDNKRLEFIIDLKEASVKD